MRFFEHQAQARRLSRRLVWLYLAAVVVMVVLTTLLLAVSLPWWRVPPEQAWLWQRSAAFFGWSAFAVVVLVLGGTVYKLRKLSRGGTVVAEELGGQRLLAAHADAAQRRLLNVVEEMALAAGLPLPRVYVLPEYGINAFAAGLHRRDAVIGITQGALQALNRDELQAVVAHEFSHILNGDMRLNMHLTGLLHGLMMIGLVGHWLVLGPRRSHKVRENDVAQGWFVFGWLGTLLGLGLMVLGGVGTLLAGWIQAAVSRQREYLADASAVQFTRQKEGLVGALHKIGSRKKQRWYAWQAGEYAHFMFDAVNEDDWLTRLSATHPPTLKRIARLDAQAARRLAAEFEHAQAGAAEEGYRGWLGFGSSDGGGGDGQPLQSPWLQPLGEMPPPLQTAEQRVLDEVMHIHPEHMAYAAWLRQSLPAAWYTASQDAEQAQALLCALLLSADTAVAERQQTMIAGHQYGLSLRVAALQARRQGLQAAHALPLVDLALPALARLPESEWQALQSLLKQLMLADQTLSLHEWCVWTVLQAHLRTQRHTAAAITWAQGAADAAQVLAWAVSLNGDAQLVEQAYAHAAVESALPPAAPPRSLSALQSALTRLDGLALADKAQLLQMVLSAIQADGRIDVAERELMRAIAANLRCPMPPLLAQAAPVPAAG